MYKKLIFIVVVLLVLSGCNSLTKERALKKENRLTDVILIEELDRNVAFALIEEEAGWIQMKSLVRSKSGWKIIDRTALISASESAEGFTGTMGRIALEDERIMYYVFGPVVDDNIDRISILDESENETTINIIVTEKGTKIYYYATFDNLDKISYKGYGTKGEVLYEMP